VWPLLACAFLSGAALLALEVIWFRFLLMFVLATTLVANRKERCNLSTSVVETPFGQFREPPHPPMLGRRLE